MFGATGRTGRCVAEAAKAEGLTPRGLVRRAGSLESSGVAEVVGDLTSAGPVAETLRGCVAACVVFGPHPPFTDLFCAAATRSIVSVMREVGVERLICQTGAMIGDYPRQRSAVFQFATGVYQRRHPGPHQDRVDQELIVRESGLQWTLLKPPRLNEGPGDTEPQVGTDLKVGLMSSVARRALARLIVSEVVRPRFIGKTLFLHG